MRQRAPRNSYQLTQTRDREYLELYRLLARWIGLHGQIIVNGRKLSWQPWGFNRCSRLSRPWFTCSFCVTFQADSAHPWSYQLPCSKYPARSRCESGIVWWLQLVRTDFRSVSVQSSSGQELVRSRKRADKPRLVRCTQSPTWKDPFDARSPKVCTRRAVGRGLGLHPKGPGKPQTRRAVCFFQAIHRRFCNRLRHQNRVPCLSQVLGLHQTHSGAFDFAIEHHIDSRRLGCQDLLVDAFAA